VYIFKRDETVWTEQTKIVASDGAAGDLFGCSVSVFGDFAVVGAYSDDDNGSDSGSAYMIVHCPNIDLTDDCFIDFEDFAVLANQWLAGYK
jgi:hypothetical protein